MKGMATVSTSRAHQAVLGFFQEMAAGVAMRDVGITRFYDKYYKGGSAFHQWRHKRKSELEYVIHHKPCAWSDLSEVLYKVLSDKELEVVLVREQAGYNRVRVDELQALIKASDENSILVGEELAAFINRFAGEKRGQ